MDLFTLLSESQALTAHLAPNDVPSIHLGLEQIEAQSRRLVSRQAAAAPGDTGKAFVFVPVDLLHALTPPDASSTGAISSHKPRLTLAHSPTTLPL